MKKALIFGVTGQDGSYLAELLISIGYQVHGVLRRSSNFNTQRLDHLYESTNHFGHGLVLHFGDVLDPLRVSDLIRQVRPDEIYNLAAQSHVKVSFEEPTFTTDVISTGTLHLLESVRQFSSDSKVYLAASSEMFGATPPIQDENSVFKPLSPYAVAKLSSYWNGVNYRSAYDLWISNGILFNHESPRRGRTFVTKKIVDAAVQINEGRGQRLQLGFLDSIRDWGYAPEYVQGMWAMLQTSKADDFVLATGQSFSVRYFLDLVFSSLGMNWKDHVDFVDKYTRPNEVLALKGNAMKAEKTLGWRPRVSLEELVEIMLSHEIDRTRLKLQHLVDEPRFTALGSQ